MERPIVLNGLTNSLYPNGGFSCNQKLPVSKVGDTCLVNKLCHWIPIAKTLRVFFPARNLLTLFCVAHFVYGQLQSMNPNRLQLVLIRSLCVLPAAMRLSSYVDRFSPSDEEEWFIGEYLKTDGSVISAKINGGIHTNGLFWNWTLMMTFFGIINTTDFSTNTVCMALLVMSDIHSLCRLLALRSLSRVIETLNSMPNNFILVK